MAEILKKIKIEGNSNVLAFVERTQLYLSKTFKEIKQDIVSEVGELLPQNFKSLRTGIPVSAIQEEKLHLQKCIGEEESGKVFSLSIQVHISLEKKDSREISTQSSVGVERRSGCVWEDNQTNSVWSRIVTGWCTAGPSETSFVWRNSFTSTLVW